MWRRLCGIVIGLMLLLVPAQGFGSITAKQSNWAATMLDTALTEALLKKYFGGSELQFEMAFAKFLDDLRQSMVTNPQIRLRCWEQLQSILAILNPTHESITQAQFETLFLSLASSGTDFGFMATKVLWPEEMLPFINANGSFMGFYAPWMKGASAKFFFPANFVLQPVGDPTWTAMVLREDLVEAIIHEFLHHVARQMFFLHYVPEFFYEPQSIPMAIDLTPNNWQNTIEHMWVYKATEAALGPLGYDGGFKIDLSP